MFLPVLTIPAYELCPFVDERKAGLVGKGRVIVPLVGIFRGAAGRVVASVVVVFSVVAFSVVGNSIGYGFGVEDSCNGFVVDVELLCRCLFLFLFLFLCSLLLSMGLGLFPCSLWFRGWYRVFLAVLVGRMVCFLCVEMVLDRKLEFCRLC